MELYHGDFRARARLEGHTSYYWDAQNGEESLILAGSTRSKVSQARRSKQGLKSEINYCSCMELGETANEWPDGSCFWVCKNSNKLSQRNSFLRREPREKVRSPKKNSGRDARLDAIIFRK